jgi:hypothetical protein
MATLGELPTEELPVEAPVRPAHRHLGHRELLIALAALTEAVELHRAIGHGAAVAMTPADHRLYSALEALEQQS